MNKDNAHLYLPLVQALADGELQIFENGKWRDIEITTFSWESECYRRKPKPRKEWVRVGLWKSEMSERCYANSEEYEKSLEKRPYFGGWLTDRIEYEVQE